MEEVAVLIHLKLILKEAGVRSVSDGDKERIRWECCSLLCFRVLKNESSNAILLRTFNGDNPLVP